MYAYEINLQICKVNDNALIKIQVFNYYNLLYMRVRFI